MRKTLCCFALATSCFLNNYANGQVVNSYQTSFNDPLKFQNSNPLLKQKIDDYLILNSNTYSQYDVENNPIHFRGDARKLLENQGKTFLKEWRGIPKENIIYYETSTNYNNSDINFDFKWRGIKAKQVFYNFKTNFKLNLSGAKVETNYVLSHNLRAKAGAKWNFGDVEFFGIVSLPISKKSNISLSANSRRNSSRLIISLRFNW